MSFNNLDTLYRQVIMDRYKNPRNHGVLEDSVTVNLNNPTCGLSYSTYDESRRRYCARGEV